MGRSSGTPVVVQAASSHQYYGFYLQGLERALGGMRLRLSRSVSPAPAQVVSGIGLEVEGRRIWIGAGDNALIEDEPLEWCDVYGVVNVTAEQLDRSPKLVPIGPGFGIRWGSLAHTVAYVARAALAMRSGPRATAARLQGSIGYHRDRLPIERYDRVRPGEADYAFAVATLWDHTRRPPPARARFIQAAHAVEGVRFEGGFVPQGDTASEVDPALLATERYPLDRYLDHVQRSVCAFNTPAVWNCLGWKLGENLALGKAIVTTELGRELPAPLEHGTHVHVVDDDVDAMAEAIALLSRDDDYRRRLEANARAYWDEWLAPPRIARRLLEAAATRRP